MQISQKKWVGTIKPRSLVLSTLARILIISDLAVNLFIKLMTFTTFRGYTFTSRAGTPTNIRLWPKDNTTRQQFLIIERTPPTSSQLSSFERNKSEVESNIDTIH